MCDACWRMAGIPQMRDSDALLYIISRAISILSRSFSTFSTASPASSPCPHRHSLPDWAGAGVRLCFVARPGQSQRRWSGSMAGQVMIVT